MNYKVAFQKVFTAMVLLCIFSGCSLFESDKQKADRFVQKGIEAKAEQKIDEAIIEFKNALQKDPLHAEAHFELGRIYLEAGKPQMAAMELNIAISQKPSMMKAKELLAQLYFRYGAYDRAIPLLKEISSKGKTTLETALMLGNALVNTDKGDEAKAILEKAEKANPDNVEAKISLARALLLLNERKQAMQMMQKAASLKPEDIGIQALLARFYENTEDYDAAQKKLLEIEKDFPENPAAYLALARFYLRRNRLSDSEKVLRRGINAGLDSSSLYQALGLIQHKQKDYSAALDSFKAAVKAAPDDQKSLIMLADYYIFLKDYANAKATYARIAEKWPQLLPVKSKIAELFIAERDYDQALNQIQQILGEDPEYARGYILKGLLMLKKGETEKARDEFIKARDLDPSSGEGDFFYGLTFLDKQNYRMSLSEILKALEKDPSSPKIRLALGYIYLKTDKPALALSELNQVLRVQPGNLRALMLRARAYAATRQYEKAEADDLKLIEKYPSASTFKLHLAQVYGAQGKFDEAIKGFTALLGDNDPNTALVSVKGLVGIYMKKNEPDKAIAVCDEALKKDSKNLKISLMKVAVLLAQKKYSDAEAYLNRIIKTHPKSIDPLMVLANLYINRQDARQDYGAALKALQKVVNMDPQNILARMKMAFIYKKLRDIENAVFAYRSILKIDEDYAPAANDLAYLYADRSQNLDEALMLAEKAHKLLPDNAEVVDTLGWVYFKQGSLLLARTHLTRAIEMMPDQPLFHFHLAMVSIKQNEPKKAARELKKSIKLGLGKNELEYAKKLLKGMKDPAHKYIDVRRNLDRAMEDGNLDQAMALAKKAETLMPDSPEIADRMGTIYMKKGSVLMAKQKFQQAMKAMPQNPLFPYHLGLALYEENDFEQAETAFKTALKLGLAKEKAETAQQLLEKIKNRDKR